jgi:hypothetical protein
MILRSALVIIGQCSGAWGLLYLPFAGAEGIGQAIGAIVIAAIALGVAILLPKNDKYP